MLTLKEVKRFLKVYHQTLFGPAISAMIFLFIFLLSSNNTNSEIGGVKFVNFMGLGLIIMTIVQNSFANSASSIIMSKVIGYVNDILMPPFTGIEIVTAYTIGGMIRGIMCGLLLSIFLMPFIEIDIKHPALLIFFSLVSASTLGIIGIIAGMASNSFDQSAAITSYLITPLSFLSGTFYSVKRLPEILQQINQFNPFFYMIDGFRYSLTDYSDCNVINGAIMLSILNIILFILAVKLFNIGWRLKS
ncbi:MAG: ABC transporter permease [Rickettsiaceae bacterium]|nr:ABC transporter permease [Rickettsiaceae bacterium]